MRLCPECGGEYGVGAVYCATDGHKLVDSGNDPLIGTQIGAYRVTKVLGAGGMGRVYLAVHPEIGSQVALKVLSEQCAKDRELVERFFSEARAVNVVRHEAIVTVLDLSTLDDGRPYIVMEYLRGLPLSSLMEKHGQLPLGTFGRIMTEILGALSAAHAAGIVHRDLKPDNVHVSPQGRAKVLDFGIAKLLPEFGPGQAKMTKTGALLGTPQYMSPEQILGQSIGPATDIYAAGVMLYEGATGKVPFRGDNLFELMQKHMSEDPVPPRQHRPDIPEAYEAVILRAMAKNPLARFASAQEMAAALSQTANSLPEGAWATISQGGQFPGMGLSPSQRQAVVGPPTEPSTSPQGAAPQPGGGRKWIMAALFAVLLTALGATLVLALGGDDSGTKQAKSSATAAPTPARSGAPTLTDAAPQPDRHRGTPPAKIPAQPGDSATASDTKETKNAPRQGKMSSPPSQPPAKSKTAGRQAADAKTEPKAAPVEPSPETKSSSVTYINTAELAKRKSGLKPIQQSVSGTSRFNVVAFLPTATKMARKLMPDAFLIHLEVDNVAPNGAANLNFGSLEASYWYRSPSRSRRPAGVPVNVEVDMPCKVYVDVSRGVAKAYPVTDEKCRQGRLRRPRCTTKQVWQRAIQMGAPTKRGTASIDLLHDGWYVDIKDGKGEDEDWSETVPDRC